MDLNKTHAVDPPEIIRERAFLLYWNQQYVDLYFPNTIDLAFFLAIGIPGNIIVIIVYQFCLHKRKGGRYFITPLAYWDLFALIITTALNLTRNTRQVIFPGTASCKLLLYFSYVSTFGSLFFLNVIAIQRFQKICRPFGKQMNVFWKRTAIGICVLFSLLLYIPVLFYYGVIEIRNGNLGNITGYQCDKLPGDSAQIQGLSIYQGVGFTITICNVMTVAVLYIMITVSIVKQMKKMNKARRPSSSTTALSDVSKDHTSFTSNSCPPESSIVSQQEPKQQKTKQKSDANKAAAFRNSLMFMTISLIAFLTYLPTWTFVVIETNNPLFWKNLSTTLFYVCLTLRRLYIFNHVANPFIYGVFDVAFREEIKRLFCAK